MKKNWIIILTLIILSFLFLFVRGGKIPFALFGLSLILPLGSILYTLIVYSKFRFSHSIDKKTAVKGEKIKYTCMFYNDDFFFYPYIKVLFYSGLNIFDTNLNTENSFSLGPGERKILNFDLSCKFRGFFDFGVKSIIIEDFLGLISLKYKVPDFKSIFIYPRLIQIKHLSLKSKYVSDLDTGTGKDSISGNIVTDIRKYSYGDCLRRIHWKASARLNQLMTKKFQDTSGQNIVLIPDVKQVYQNSRDNAICEDLLIESLLSLSYYFLTHWVHITYILLDHNMNHFSCENYYDYQSAYRLLSKIKFKANYDICLTTKQYFRNQVNKSSLIFFIISLSLEIFTQIYDLKQAGYDISLVLINAVPHESESESRVKIVNTLLELGVVVYDIQSTACIKREFEHKKIPKEWSV